MYNYVSSRVNLFLPPFFSVYHSQFIGKVGVVQDFTSNGDVVVEYPDKSWRYNPKALTKVIYF